MEPKKVATVEGITEYSLPNGVRFLLFPDPSASNVTVNMTVLVGSRHEGYGETGMAHLLEHMLFKGSPLFPDARQGPGGPRRHASTAPPGSTAPTTTKPCRPPTTTSSSASSSRPTASSTASSSKEDLDKEMTVVRNEFEQGENSPEYILSQRMMSVAFEWHNYGKSTIGNRTDIERVPIDRLAGLLQEVLPARQHRADRRRQVRRGQGARLRQPVLRRPQDPERAGADDLHRGAAPGRRTHRHPAAGRQGGHGRGPVSHAGRGAGRQSAAGDPEHGPGQAPVGPALQGPGRDQEGHACLGQQLQPARSVHHGTDRPGGRQGDAGGSARHHDRRRRRSSRRSRSPRKKSTGPSSSICPTASSRWPTARKSAWS